MGGRYITQLLEDYCEASQQASICSVSTQYYLVGIIIIVVGFVLFFPKNFNEKSWRKDFAAEVDLRKRLNEPPPKSLQAYKKNSYRVAFFVFGLGVVFITIGFLYPYIKF